MYKQSEYLSAFEVTKFSVLRFSLSLSLAVLICHVPSKKQHRTTDTYVGKIE